jgi:hypothetical protein
MVREHGEVSVNGQLPTLSPTNCLTTRGGDKPYALAMTAARTSVDISLDFIGSDLSVLSGERGRRRPATSR